jgi:DNA-binding winged helix-turn-helix (wHTH) protein
MRQPAKQFYEFGPFRLDPVERVLYRDGEVVSLTAKIFEILLVFVQNSGRTMEKDEMMREVWPDQFVEEGNLTRNVSTLRKALGESQDNHHYCEPSLSVRSIINPATTSACASPAIMLLR